MSPARVRIVEKSLNFETVQSADVPHDRKGKHNALIMRILQDLERIRPGVALKIPVSALGSQKVQNIRAALAREIKKTRFAVNTAFDDDNFYVWRRNR